MSEIAFENQEDALFGLLAGITSVMEVLVSKKIVPPETLAKMLATQRSAFLEKKQPDSARMVELMMRPLTEPGRAAARSLGEKPPEGHA